MLTGKTRISGRHTLRTELRSRLLDRGARVLQDGTYNRRVTLMVLGDLTPERVTDPVNGRSKKLVFVDTARADGHHICVVDDAGLSALLDGRPATCLKTRRVDGVETVEVRRPSSDPLLGAPLRKRSAPSYAPVDLNIDLSGLERGTAAHEDLLQLLMDHLAPVELRGPRSRGPQFDAAWWGHGEPPTLYVVEAKSLTGAREDQQIRLGIGQLLDYCRSVEGLDGDGAQKVVPVLVLERAPTDGRWADLTRSLGIILTYGPDFPGLGGLG
jgi:hypothetical protein